MRVQILVRGVGDVGSAVALRLFGDGHAVLLTDGPQPTAARRGMAFADAVFDGTAELDGVRAVRLTDLGDVEAALDARVAIPVVVGDPAPVLATVRPDVVVDAQMRKRATPEPQRGLAPLTVGLGPGFVAGETTDLVIETGWGDDLGQAIAEGSARPLAGEPKLIGGHARERYVYAPIAGVFRTGRRIGDTVTAEDVVAWIGDTELSAPLNGVLRGLTRDGVPVSVGTKVLEVDPRGADAVVAGIGERPERIAAGVADAVWAWARGRT